MVSLYVLIGCKYITKIQRMSEGKSHKNKRKEKLHKTKNPHNLKVMRIKGYADLPICYFG